MNFISRSKQPTKAILSIVFLCFAFSMTSLAQTNERRYEAPDTYLLNLKNNSMWTVRYRVQDDSGRWSKWVTVKSGKEKYIEMFSPLYTYDIEWLDIHKWLDKWDSTPVLNRTGDTFTVTGNTFTGIQIE